jgi:hypothetical protein
VYILKSEEENVMAQVVGYFQDNVAFTEGPFVIVYAGGWRIEVEQKKINHPIMTSLSIDRHIKRLGIPHGKTKDMDLARSVCDGLNAMVRAGEIVLTDWGSWVDKNSVIQARQRADQILREVQ